MLSTKSKKKLLKKSRLYAIVDRQVCGRRAISAIAAKTARSGVDIIQFRDKRSKIQDVLKQAQNLSGRLLARKVIFIINDYLEIARLTDSDGVHLGQDDVPVRIARRILGDDKIIGVSCHSARQALAAQKAGADYISVGPVFATPTKPEYRPVGLGLVKKCSQRIKIPLFAIGGINLKNISCVTASGAKRLALCRPICQARNIPLMVNKFKSRLRAASANDTTGIRQK